MPTKRADIFDFLQKQNPRINKTKIIVFVDAALTYSESTKNITKNGVIVAHPRTGAPIDNPYLKSRKMAGDTISKIKLNDAGLWEILEKYEPPKE